MELNQQLPQKFTIEAKVIRANGKVENLGTIVGGNFIQKMFSFLRIKAVNLKHKHGNSSN